MLFKKSMLCLASLSVIFICFDASAMRRRELPGEKVPGGDDSYGETTPVYKNRKMGSVDVRKKRNEPSESKSRKKKNGASGGKRKVVSDETAVTQHMANMERVWKLFAQHAADDKRIDIPNVKFAFARVVQGMSEDEQFEVLNYFLANAMNGDKDFRTWLQDIEQISDGTPKVKYEAFKAIVNSNSPK